MDDSVSSVGLIAAGAIAEGAGWRYARARRAALQRLRLRSRSATALRARSAAARGDGRGGQGLSRQHRRRSARAGRTGRISLHKEAKTNAQYPVVETILASTTSLPSRTVKRWTTRAFWRNGGLARWREDHRHRQDVDALRGDADQRDGGDIVAIASKASRRRAFPSR